MSWRELRLILIGTAIKKTDGQIVNNIPKMEHFSTQECNKGRSRAFTSQTLDALDKLGHNPKCAIKTLSLMQNKVLVNHLRKDY